MNLCHHEDLHGGELYWADDMTTVIDEQRRSPPCCAPNVRTTSSPKPLLTRGELRPKCIKKTVCVEIREMPDSHTDCPACMYISMEKKLRRTHELLEYLPAADEQTTVFRCALFKLKKLLSKFKRMIIPEIDLNDSLWPTCEKEYILAKLRKSRLPNNYVVFGDKAIRHEVACVS